MLVFVVLAIIVMFGVSDVFANGSQRADGGVKIALKAPYDLIYPINVPTDVKGFGVVEDVQEYDSWFCDNDQTIEVKNKYKVFSLPVRVSEMNKWNVGKLSLTGADSSGLMRDITGYMSADPAGKTVYVEFAGQYCAQQFEQYYDDARQTWMCRVQPEMVCNAPEYYLNGRLLLTVVPYLR